MSEYELIELECPNCQAPLTGRSGANIVTCEFCGTQVRVVKKASHSDGAIVIRDGAGMPLLHTMVPFDWDVNSASLDPTAGSGEWPYLIRAELTDGNGSFIRYKSPLEYGCRGAKMERLMATYGNSATAAMEPLKRPFPIPAEFYLGEAREAVGQFAQNISYIGQLPHPTGDAARQKEAELIERQRREIQKTAAQSGVSVSIDDVYARALCRLFSFQMSGVDYRIAVASTIFGNKTAVNTPMMGVGGMVDLLGGLFSGPQTPPQGQPYAPPNMFVPQPQNAAGLVPGTEDDARADAFRQQSAAQDISWEVLDTFCLICPADKFDVLFNNVFPEVVSNMKIDSFLLQQKEQFVQNGKMNLDASVREFKAQSNAMLQQSMAYARQQSAMMDQRMADYQRQSDAHHRQVMESSASMFSDSGSSISDKWSEAILGQNTYVDQYGDEHTVSNRWDEAYRSDSGDIIGVEKGVDPGYGWTKLDPKN